MQSDNMDFPLDEFVRGLKEEQEHLSSVDGNEFTVARLVLDHLEKNPKYYSELAKTNVEEKTMQKKDDEKLEKKPDSEAEEKSETTETPKEETEEKKSEEESEKKPEKEEEKSEDADEDDKPKEEAKAEMPSGGQSPLDMIDSQFRQKNMRRF